jgi:PAS domain S-box-containing protein
MNANPVEPLRLMQVTERALDYSDNVIVILEPASAEGSELHIVAVNGAFCRAFRMTAQDATGRTLASLAAEENDPALVAAIADAVAARRSLRTEMRCRNGEGASFWFGLHLMASVDAGTGQYHFVLLGCDITERKNAGAQQKAIQLLLAGVFLCVDAAVFIASAEGRILMTNPHFDQMFGYPPGGLIGRPSIDLVAPCTYDMVMQVRRGAIENGTDFSIDSVGLRRDGSEIPVHISSVVAHGKDMERFRIVTARTRATEQSTPAAEQAYRAVGMIKLVCMEEVKAALGPRWPEVAERAMQTAEHVIAKSLGPGETCSRAQDHGFLICFGMRSEEEASFAAAMIGRRIRERLVGQGEDLAALQVTAIATRVDVPEATEDPGAKVDLAALLERRLNARRFEIEARARRILAEMLEETSCAMAPVQARDGPRVVAYYAVIPKPAFRAMVTAHGGLPPVEQASLDLDSAMLGLAADRVQQGLLSDPVGTVFVDVDFAVFQVRAATQSYIETCRKLNPVLHQRLILVLTHLPAGISSSRLQECVQRLRPFCRSVAFAIDEPRLAPSDPVFDHAPILAIGADRVTGPGSAERLGKLLATVHGKHGRLLARNVPDASTAALLRLAGVDLLAMAKA